MAIRPIIVLPDPLLKKNSEPVTVIDEGIHLLVQDMFDTMYDAPGIGLAAIQIGIPKRVIVMDVSKSDDRREPHILINPEIIWTSEDMRIYEEGCLSIPDYNEDVERPDKVRVRALNMKGETIELEADGLLATCIQHEIDHLNGVLFIDHLSKLKRDRVTKKFIKAARREGEGS